MGLSVCPSKFPFAYDYTSQLTGIDEHPTGSGGFSSVFKCEVHGKEKAIKLAQREFNLWFPLKHPYILPLDGICYFQFEREIPSFVSPWQKNGTIIEYVRTRPDVDLLHMLECIAMAVGYLHDNDIIHMDLRGANILVSDNGDPLVSDFGIGKIDSGMGVMVSTEAKGNSRYMPYEFFKHQDGKFHGSDARRSWAWDSWSFGMVIQEILTGNVPYHDDNLEPSIIHKIGAGTLPQFGSAQHRTWEKLEKPLRELTSRCLNLEPYHRPLMAEIVPIIKQVPSSIYPV
ncbi:kinase-like domain-containing protein [Phellopilus nigrolimitatus]|nr:kinase-like domain-containing protein [Phellopilus nigrolimitatus]